MSCLYGVGTNPRWILNVQEWPIPSTGLGVGRREGADPTGLFVGKGVSENLKELRGREGLLDEWNVGWDTSAMSR